MLSLAYITTEGADPVAQIVAAASAGFAAVGLRALQPTGRPLTHPLLDDPTRVREVVAALRDTNIRLLDLEVLTLSSSFTVPRASAFLDLAAMLGAREVQIVCEDHDLDRAADQLALLAHAAAERGLGVALEFMAFRTVDTLETALRVAERGRARILVDALHFVRSGGMIADLAAAPPGRIAYFQICDAPASLQSTDLIQEARFDRLFPGEGALPLQEMLTALPGGLSISVEVPRASMTGLSAKAKAETAMKWMTRFQFDRH